MCAVSTALGQRGAFDATSGFSKRQKPTQAFHGFCVGQSQRLSSGTGMEKAGDAFATGLAKRFSTGRCGAIQTFASRSPSQALQVAQNVASPVATMRRDRPFATMTG